MTRALKNMILQALDAAGGQQYLAEQATKNPAAFLTLLGKVLPLTLAGDTSEPLSVCVTRYSSPDDQRRDELRQPIRACARAAGDYLRDLLKKAAAL